MVRSDKSKNIDIFYNPRNFNKILRGEAVGGHRAGSFRSPLFHRQTSPAMFNVSMLSLKKETPTPSSSSSSSKSQTCLVFLHLRLTVRDVPITVQLDTEAFTALISSGSSSVPVSSLQQDFRQASYRSRRHVERRGKEETPGRRGPTRRWQGSATLDQSLSVSTPVLLSTITKLILAWPGHVIKSVYSLHQGRVIV